MESKTQRRASHFVNIIREIEKIPADAVILDLGCGNGDLVLELRKLGFHAFGCDFQYKPGENVQYLAEKNLIRTINPDYRLPFEDAFFNVVITDNVLEHVMNYSTTMAEIHRVIRPGGCSLHMFSSRYRFLEVHKHVPLASIIRTRGWLSLWASVGIRTQNQKFNNMNSKEVTEDNYLYLNSHTNYLSRGQLTRETRKFFKEVRFCEKHFLKHSARGKYLFVLSKIFPQVPAIYSTFRNRVMFAKK